MRFRRAVIVVLSAFALIGATIGATFAATSSQSTGGESPEGATADVAPDPKAYLGVHVQPLNDRIRERLELPADIEGAVVLKAQRNSPAAEAGFERGDVILTANDAAITGPKDLRAVVSNASPGDSLVIVYYRDGGEHTVSVTLAERPQRDSRRHRVRVQNPLKRFLNVFPKAVDGSFRVLDDDGNVQVYEMAQGSITELGGASLTIEKATGETATFEIGDETLIVLKGQKVELSDLEEGSRAVVLSVDGAVKAVVVGQSRPAPDARPHLRNGFGPRLDRLESHFRALRDRMHRFHPPVEEPSSSSELPADSTAA